MKKSTVTPGLHTGVYAKNVAPGGSAERGGVKGGDEIVQVNRTNMADLSYQDVIMFFKKIPKKTTFALKRDGFVDDDTKGEKPLFLRLFFLKGNVF